MIDFNSMTPKNLPKALVATSAACTLFYKLKDFTIVNFS